MDVVAPVCRGFLLFFIFYYFYFIGHFVVYAYCLCGSVERREHFFSWHDYVSRSYAGDVLRAKRGSRHGGRGQHQHHGETPPSVKHRQKKDKKKKEGHADTKRYTQQANKQDHRNDTDSTQQTNGPRRHTPR